MWIEAVLTLSVFLLLFPYGVWMYHRLVTEQKPPMYARLWVLWVFLYSTLGALITQPFGLIGDVIAGVMGAIFYTFVGSVIYGWFYLYDYIFLKDDTEVGEQTELVDFEDTDDRSEAGDSQVFADWLTFEPSEGESTESKDRIDLPSWQLDNAVATGLAALGGAFVALALGFLSAPVTIAIAGGALAATLVASGADYPRFAGAGGTFLLLSPLLFALFPSSLPSAYIEDAFMSMLLFGTVALAFVALQELGQLILRRLFGDRADQIMAVWRAVTAAIAAALTLLFAERLWRKAAQYGGIGVGGPLLAGLDILGYELPAPLFFVDGVNAIVILFVGIVTALFFTLDTLYAAYHTAIHAGQATAAAGSAAADAGTQATTRVRNRYQDKDGPD